MTLSGKPLTVALLLLVLASCLLSLPSTTQGGGNVKDARLHLTGDAVLGTNKVGYYSATLVDPQERSWKYDLWVTADNETGASPLQDSPITGNITKDNRTFTFNITAQTNPGPLTIHVNCTSTTGNFWYLKEETVAVVEPVTITANIKNPTNTQVKNATIRFFVDGTEVDSSVIDSINARQAMEVSGEWISADKSPGWHESEVWVDLNSDGTIDASTGDMIITQRFYIEGESPWLTWLIVIVGLASLTGGLMYISKQKVR